MRFTYWHGAEHAPIAPALAHWRKTFPEFEVVDDAAVEAELTRSRPAMTPLFRRLRIPACRSDVARLVMLEARGGFYADVHFAISDPAAARSFVEGSGAPMVMLTRAARAGEAAGLRPINGLMAAAAGHPLVRAALSLGLERLARRMDAEDGGSSEPYDIFDLAGSGAIRAVLMQTPLVVNPSYRDEVRFVPEVEAPFQRNVFKSYQTLGGHWSERQLCEPLFHP